LINMPDRGAEKPFRDIADDLDERLRDAERLRNHAEERRQQRAFWPDRRRGSRVPEPTHPEPASDRRSH